MADISVRPLTRGEQAAALAILVDVFAADPSWQRVIRVRRLVRPLLTRYYRRCLRDLIPESNADGAWDGDRLVGVALWYPPRQRPEGLLGRIPRLFSAWKRQSRRKPDNQPERTGRNGWLLEGIAVSVHGRSKGIGSLLLSHRLDGCTEPVHLESTTEASARLYRRYGFVDDPDQNGGDLQMTRHPANG